MITNLINNNVDSFFVQLQASYKQGNNQVLISDMTSAGKPFMLTKTYKLNSFAVQYSKFSTFVEDCKVVDKNVEFDKVKKNIATQIVKGLKVICLFTIKLRQPEWKIILFFDEQFLATNPNPTANAFVDLKTLTVSAQKQGDLLKESKVDFKPNFIESKFGVAIPEGVFDVSFNHSQLRPN